MGHARFSVRKNQIKSNQVSVGNIRRPVAELQWRSKCSSQWKPSSSFEYRAFDITRLKFSGMLVLVTQTSSAFLPGIMTIGGK
jgi:hypothetical protein